MLTGALLGSARVPRVACGGWSLTGWMPPGRAHHVVVRAWRSLAGRRPSLRMGMGRARGAH